MVLSTESSMTLLMDYRWQQRSMDLNIHLYGRIELKIKVQILCHKHSKYRMYWL